VVMWLNEHGAELMFKCYTRGVRQNALSLACYNSQRGVLNYLLGQFSRFIVQPWVITAIDDLIYALTRYSLSLEASHYRFDKILNLCTHNSVSFKTCIVMAVSRRLEELLDHADNASLQEDRLNQLPNPKSIPMVSFCETIVDSSQDCFHP
jgi:hypothetical protein